MLKVRLRLCDQLRRARTIEAIEFQIRRPLRRAGKLARRFSRTAHGRHVYAAIVSALCGGAQAQGAAPVRRNIERVCDGQRSAMRAWWTGVVTAPLTPRSRIPAEPKTAASSGPIPLSGAINKPAAAPPRSHPPRVVRPIAASSLVSLGTARRDMALSHEIITH
jgi:hypothetical protein